MTDPKRGRIYMAPARIACRASAPRQSTRAESERIHRAVNAIDGAIDGEWRGDLAPPQARNESQRLPLSLLDPANNAPAAFPAPTQAPCWRRCWSRR